LKARIGVARQAPFDQRLGRDSRLTAIAYATWSFEFLPLQ
jgi:hypothetical protein